MSRRIICKLVKDFMLYKDPYVFRNYPLCNCSHLCHVQVQETDDNNYCPKNYNEYTKIRKLITEDNNYLKKNWPDAKDS